MKEFEVFTTTDKDRRDEMFQFFRREGDENERKAVKFSGVEPVLHSDGKPMHHEIQYFPTGKIQRRLFRPKTQLRPDYRSTWSVAYPRSI